MIRICQITAFNLRFYQEQGIHTALASVWSTGNGNPGDSGMTMQHFHGLSSRFARMIRLTRASPIPFSIFTSLMTVLRVGNKLCSQLYNFACLRRDKELVLNVHKMLRLINRCFGSGPIPAGVSGGLTCYVCVLDRVFSPTWCAKRPRSSRATNLHLASSCETHGLQLSRFKFWRRQ